MKSAQKSRLKKPGNRTKNNSRVSRKTGLPPGTLVHIGDVVSPKVSIRLTEIDEDSLVERQINNISEISTHATGHERWIEVCGLNQVDTLDSLGKVLDINVMVMEDILNTEHRPKFEEHAGKLFFTLKALYFSNDQQINQEQVSFVLGDHFLVSFTESNRPLFQSVKDRLPSMAGKIRQRGLDYLLYALIDVTVDQYYSVVESINDQLEEMEDTVFDNPGREVIDKVLTIRKDVSAIRKAMIPLQEAVNKLIKSEPELIDEETLRYYADIQDHIIQITDAVDSCRELSAELKESYLSNLTYRMNQVMKLLTIITTIFIPLSFIAGIYGMNFENMPELQWKYGYFAVLIVMFTILISMLAYFRIKKWL